jgi:hypothetical protein
MGGVDGTEFENAALWKVEGGVLKTTKEREMW